MRSFLGVPRYFAVLIILLIFNVVAFAQASTSSPLPAPTGPYAVGRTSFDWIDTSRPDPESLNGHREVVVLLWYPASPKEGAEPAEWVPGKWGEHFLPDYLAVKFSGQVLSEITTGLKEHPISSIHTHAYPDAAILHGKTKFPVLLFEPGFGDVPFIYATMIEDLASHGYVVAAAIPTYYTHYNVFSHDRVIVAQKNHPTGSNKPNGNEHPMETAFRLWTGDMIFMLNQLDKLDADAKSQFKGRFNFAELGAFGHSFGGAASVQVAKDDPRVRAALDLDGTLDGDVVASGLFKPFLMFNHPHPGQTNFHRDDVVFRDAKPAYRLTLANSEHHFSADFGVLPFFPPSARAGIGSIDPTRALAITKTYVEAFFDKYLEGKPAPLLSGPSPEFPEITFETNRNLQGK